MSEKWGQLLDRIASLTEAGKLSWNESSDGDEISTDLSGTRVEITFLEWEESFLLVLKDELDLPVDQFTDDELTEVGYEGAFKKFSRLFKTVRRQNSGAEKALDSLLEKLSKLDRPF